MSRHLWIDDPANLAMHIAGWGSVHSVALDTEFMRERTFWPQLALVQIATPDNEQALLVDATIDGMCAALRPLLADPSILKLMHSAGEDVQALQHACGFAPAPLFDTQIAATLSGLGVGMGYQKLVDTLLGINLPKTQTRSDWLRRPLSPEQLDYAADDVVHLHAVHAILRQRVRELGRESWVGEDCARLVATMSDATPDAHPHLALRGATSLDAIAQARLCRLLRWREMQARATDRPKGWIIDNELAMTLARKPPANIHAFHALLDASPKAPRKSRGELWTLLETPLTEAERDIPLARNIAGTDKQRLRAMQDAVAAEAARLAIDPGALASRRVLESLLDGKPFDDAITGWRHDVLRSALTPLLVSCNKPRSNP
ncbi:MAG: ribonuclease D [Proteobacteria bacterium]|nr:ribonuclease D [Pseudomonadota bacterium]